MGEKIKTALEIIPLPTGIITAFAGREALGVFFFSVWATLQLIKIILNHLVELKRISLELKKLNKDL